MGYDSYKVPALYKSIKWRPNTINLDIGGGAHEDTTCYLAKQGVTNVVYDPDHRSKKHNKNAIQFVIDNKFCHSASLVNVLNVIPSWKDRDAVLYYTHFLAKEGATIYIGIYEGDGSGVGEMTRDGWQANLRLNEYCDVVLNRNRFRFESNANNMIRVTKISPYLN